MHSTLRRTVRAGQETIASRLTTAVAVLAVAVVMMVSAAQVVGGAGHGVITSAAERRDDAPAMARRPAEPVAPGSVRQGGIRSAGPRLHAGTAADGPFRLAARLSVVASAPFAAPHARDATAPGHRAPSSRAPPRA